MKEDIFNIIYQMICDYEKYTDEKPFIILISPETYIELREYLQNTNAWRYLEKLGSYKEKIKYMFGIPIEISNIIIQKAICMNEKDYKKYCEKKYILESQV